MIDENGVLFNCPWTFSDAHLVFNLLRFTSTFHFDFHFSVYANLHLSVYESQRQGARACVLLERKSKKFLLMGVKGEEEKCGIWILLV